MKSSKNQESTSRGWDPTVEGAHESLGDIRFKKH